MIEDVRIAVLVHALQERNQGIKSLREELQAFGHRVAVVHPSGRNGR